jgi:D-serine deaminase-like pyridoxal phosphate-dependent protein
LPDFKAYQGAMQHLDDYQERKAKIAIAIAMVADAVEALKSVGLECDIVGGGGTGSYYFEGESGVYNELQCGSYALWMLITAVSWIATANGLIRGNGKMHFSF